jgi:ribosomal protein L11 methyltransferase
MDNGRRNSVESSLTVFLPEDFSSSPVPLMLANILAGPLVELAPRLAQLTQAGGDIVLSGILEDQACTVSEAYSPWFTMDKPVVIDGWVRLHGVKQG